VKLRQDVLRELLESPADHPKDIRRHDHNERDHERALDRLLVLFAAAVSRQNCGIAMHGQSQNNGFRIELL
jgi:hypothetical protein